MPLPLPLTVIAGVVVATGFAAALVNEAKESSATRRHWEAVAAARGLSFDAGLTGQLHLSGTVDGRAVRVAQVSLQTSNKRMLHTRVAIELATPLPPGLEMDRPVLGGALVRRRRVRHLTGDGGADGAYAIYGPDTAHMRRLATNPRLARALSHAASNGCRVTLQGDDLEVTRVGRGLGDLDHRLDAALHIARAICAAAESPWRRAMERFGLTLERSEHRTRLLREDGLGVLTATTRLDEPTLPTRITLRFPAPLGEPFSVTGPSSVGLPHLVTIGDPILDGMVAVSSQSPQTTRTLLRQTEVRGPLLSVVHAFPLSRVTEAAVILHLDELEPGALAERIGDVIDLGKALTAARLATTTRSPPPEVP